MAHSSGSDSDSDSLSNKSTSESENSTDEEFVLREKKIGYRLKGDGETHISTKKSHSEGRRYRKQEVSSSSSGGEETIAKKQRVLSSVSVVVKGKEEGVSSSSDDEDKKYNDKKEYKVKNRKSHRSENQKPIKKEDYDPNPHIYRDDSERNKDRHPKEYDKRRDYDDHYNDKYIHEHESKYSREEKSRTKRGYVKEEFDSNGADDKKSHRSKHKVEKSYIKSEYDPEPDLKDHRKRRNDNKIKTEDKYKLEEDIRNNIKYEQKEHSNDYKNHNRNNHRKDGANNRDWDVGPNEYSKGLSDESELSTTGKKPIEKETENYELSGKLTEYTNTYNGVVIIYNEPPEARKPKTRWRFYPFKGEKALTMLQLHRQSAFLLGRDRKVADIPVDHPSCSKQHAVLQFRLVPFEKANGEMGKKVKPYIIDLDSRNGTHVNNKRIEARKYVELLERDVVKFGFSSRDYVLLHEKSEDVDSAEDEGEK